MQEGEAKQKKRVAERIIKNYHYAECMKKRIAKETNNEQKMLLIKYLLHFNVNHVMGRYSDEWIEEQLQLLSKRYIHFTSRKKEKKGHILHVMTQASEIGGHTALVNNWIDFDCSRTYSIVFTDMERKDVPQFLITAVNRSGGNIYFLHGNEYHKAEELLRISESYEKIILNVHMFDVVPILAYSTENWKRPVYFYNHGNFLFSIGISIADCYLTLCEYDTYKAKKYRGTQVAYTLQMPMKVIAIEKAERKNAEEIRNELMSQYHFQKGDKIILSMGDDYKYKKIIGFDFAEFAERLMKRLPSNYYFIIIGADPSSIRWKKLYKKTKGHVQAIGRQSRKEVSKWMKCAEVYITSFPMSSAGRQEAIENGIPTFTMAVTNRVKTVDQHIMKYDTVEEMIEDIYITLCEDKMSENDMEVEKTGYNCNPSEWCKHLEAAYNKANTHKMHEFVSIPCISKEEIVNEQLIEEKYPFTEMNTMSFYNRAVIGVCKRMLRV